MAKKDRAKKSKVKKSKNAGAVPGPGTGDAMAVLKLYELRREPVMRASRDTLLAWKPNSVDDILAIADHQHPSNAAYRQVGSYFEMAFGLARRGAVHPELLVDWCGEGLLLFAKLEPYLKELRERTAPAAFSNAEWVARETKAGAAKIAYFRTRFGRMEKDEEE